MMQTSSGSPTRETRTLGVLALLGPLLVSGCSLLPLGGRPNSAPGGETTPMDAGLRDYRAVVHCHSYLSHDSEGSVEEIAAAAKELGFNAVFLNDHYAEGNVARSPRGLHQGILFVPGVELRLARGGSLLAFGTHSDFKKQDNEANLIARLQGDGAFLAAGHVEAVPEGRDLTWCGGFEVYNLHAQVKTAARLGLAVRFLFYPIDCFLESLIQSAEENLPHWDRELARGRCLTVLAGHDAHANVRVLGSLGGTIGTYAEVFRLFSTHILARNLTEEAMLSALRQGRTFVVFDYLGDGAGFSMRYAPLEGKRATWAILGDRAPFRDDARIVVRLPSSARLRLLRDGAPVFEEDGKEFVVRPSGPGIYRAEVYRKGNLWIVASPIHLEGSAPASTPSSRSGTSANESV